MNYEKIYNTLIEFRQKNKYIGYTEKHHIIPRSLGGCDSSENIVKLSAREHYICHLLLTKMYPKNSYNYYKMINAFFMMCNAKSDKQDRQYKINSHIYEYLKTDYSKSMSALQTGENNSQYGTMWIYSDEYRTCKRINKNDIIPDGWKSGRILNFSYLDKICHRCNVNLNLENKSNRKYCDLCRNDILKENAETRTIRKCICDGKEYESITKASIDLKMRVQKIRSRIISKNFENYYYL